MSEVWAGPRWRGWLVVAVALVFLLGAGVLGYLLVVSANEPTRAANSPASAEVPPAAARPPAVSADAPMLDAQLSALARRLAALGYQVTPKASVDDSDCVVNSSGLTRDYLSAHRCVGMHRALLEARDRRGATALIALAWVGMPDPAEAAGLRAVLDRPGTGSVTALSGDEPRYRGVVFNGLYYASARQGPAVATAEAQPLGPGLTRAQLKSIAAAAVS